MLFIKAFTSYFHIYRPPTPPTVPSPHRPSSSSYCPIGAIHRHRRKNRRRAVSYVSTGLACLPRDNNASPIYHRRAVVETSSLGLHSLVAERRHSSVTRYAKRSVACRDSPRHQTLRAGGTPLPRHPSDCASPSSAIIIGLRIHTVRHNHHLIAPTAQYTAIGEKTAEERFNMLARGWLAYPVTPTPHPSTAEERLYKRHPGKTHFGDAPYAESGASVSRKPRSSP